MELYILQKVIYIIFEWHQIKLTFWHHRFNNIFDKKSEVKKVQYRKTLLLNYETCNYVARNNSVCIRFTLET